MKTYHIPALISESIQGLSIRPEGTYVDVTFGGGGHSAEILKHLKNGSLYAFDQDTDALENTLKDKRLTLVHGNFRYLKNYLRYLNVDQVDGIIADLGVSFHQIDELSRGFSFKSDAEIDMRMNKNSDFTAAKLLNEYDVSKLAYILGEYGEVPNSWRIAQAVVEKRNVKRFGKISELVEVLEKFAPKKIENKFYAKVFQALRIEVNHEMDALIEFLETTPSVLKKGGRLVVISYHSLEDRLVKNFMRSGNIRGEIEKDIYGNYNAPLLMVNRKVIVPHDNEINTNARARSAKLRIAEKN
jgi:16S rRNA (cytosine1402-N4)-methyltransferase